MIILMPGSDVTLVFAFGISGRAHAEQDSATHAAGPGPRPVGTAVRLILPAGICRSFVTASHIPGAHRPAGQGGKVGPLVRPG